MPPDKGHRTTRRTPRTLSSTLAALLAVHPPQTIEAAALTSALWPSKNIIIIKMKMKQKKKRKKKTKGARNKIKEMLFHNANCAASITPQLATVPIPPVHVWY